MLTKEGNRWRRISSQDNIKNKKPLHLAYKRSNRKHKICIMLLGLGVIIFG